jgi:hypothetical protein
VGRPAGRLGGPGRAPGPRQRGGGPGRPAGRLADPPWEQAAADAALAQALALIDSTAGLTASQVNVLEVYRTLVVGYHARRDPLLFEASAAVRALLSRWAVDPVEVNDHA